MTDIPEDDFAALFEASVQTRRLENGQAVEGPIVAIGPEVAFVSVFHRLNILITNLVPLPHELDLGPLWNGVLT